MQMKRTLASLLPNLLTTCFKQHNTTIKLLDVGSGPTYLGAKPIIDKLLEQGKHIDMTVSEVDETSLFKLLQEQQNNTNISAVKFFDLSQIKTIPSQFILSNQYNIVTASLVLHQLTTQQINEALKFFTNITQVGGLIINPDVGESGGFYQCLVNPSNEIDLEGYITDYTKHSFFKTAVILENKVKIAYPLRQYSHGFPSAEFALYTIEIFLIIEIDLAALPTLENLWQKGSYTEVDRLVQPFTAFNLVSNIKP